MTEGIKTEHSELPWKVVGSGLIFAKDTSGGREDGIVQVGEIGNFRDPELVEFNGERWKADAAFIVKAANLHQELVEAVEFLQGIYGADWVDDLVRRAKQ